MYGSGEEAMSSTKPPGREKGKPVSISGQGNDAFVQKKGTAERSTKPFESELAAEIIAELYPLLLENCTDEDDEVDSQAVFESLAGLVGLFMADYRDGYGDEKARQAFQDLIDLALNVYDERQNAAE
jgi:hypothetical protein